MYWVNIYSPGTFQESNAQVTIFTAAGLLKQMSAPPVNNSNTWWNAFNMVVSGDTFNIIPSQVTSQQMGPPPPPPATTSSDIVSQTTRTHSQLSLWGIIVVFLFSL
jgi:hypothetical protein